MKNKSDEKKFKLKSASFEAARKNRLYHGLFPALAVIFFFSFAVAALTKAISAETLVDVSDNFSLNGWIQILSTAGVLFVLLGSNILYLHHTSPDMLLKKRYFFLFLSSIALTYIVSLILGKFISLYAMPMSLGGLFIATFIGRRQGIASNLFCCLSFFMVFLIMFGEQSVMGIAIAMVTNAVAGTVVIIFLDKSYTRIRFLFGGFIVALIMMPVSFAVSFLTPDFSWTNLFYAVVWTAISAFLSIVLFIPLLPVYEYIFKLPTNFNLEEICSFDSPLLKRLSQEAPGTFNHSLSVGNLAQLCAIAIGDNPQLAKAGAYYHDIGKLKDPTCYIENQKDYNPHDDFIPEVSVYMITQHTNWGYEMLRASRNIPEIIADIAKEHHGTTPVNYFYYKVKSMTEGDVDANDFRYDGPIPSSKISAIIMIVDTVEAAIRAIGIGDEKSLRANIHKLVDEKLKLGQFDNSKLTLKDIKTIEDTLAEALPSIYHNRISYTNVKR